MPRGEDTRNHPNRKVGNGASGVCTNCADDRHYQMHGVPMGTEEMLPVGRLEGFGQYVKGSCTNCGRENSVLFQTNPVTGEPLRKNPR